MITFFAGILRFWDLSHPDVFTFDETYYAKDSWSMVHQGTETVWPDDANSQILAGNIPMGTSGEFIAHPPLGKWIIGLGELVFGMNPLGWRVMTALFGTAAIFLLARIGTRLFGSLWLGCTAALLMACDGLELVMSRTGLLDIFVMFFALAAFGCLLVDRDRVRERDTGRPYSRWRWWRLAAGALLGCCCAVKWNGWDFLAAFGLLTVCWDIANHRRLGSRHPYRAMLRRDALPAFASLVLVACAVYVLTWAGWFLSDNGYDRHSEPTAIGSWFHYQFQIWDFDTTLTAPHPYQSNPWSWLVMGRPVCFFWQKDPDGSVHEILALGTPLLWWAACLSLAYALYRWFFRRDWRFGAVLCAVAAGFVPWLQWQERTTFSYYMVVISPFLCLGVTGMLGAIIAGRDGASRRRRRIGTVAAGVVVIAVFCCFCYFLPLYVGAAVPYDTWHQHMWWPTWI
ncbi:dolichyl-phosphate-mannose--protein mannosyltransferase [Streptomyces fractus]|uniref:dolichyl-phosphate-mannose--protein mannosyltransferase n=1 Tax=Streptomyces fractus TaxID=641806 RepID=UPI003CF4A2DB